MLAAALAGAGTLWWQHHKVLAQAEASEQVGRLFASTLGTATLSGLGSARFSSRALLESTERELRTLPLADQPGLRAHALATLARGYAKIGDYRHAAALAAQAQSLADSADGSDEDGFIVATRLETFNYDSRYSEALSLANERLQRLQGRHDAAATEARIAVGSQQARALWGNGQPRQALARADELLRLAQPRNDLVAYALILRSGFLSGLGRLPQAEADAQRALTLARPLDPVLADDALERLTEIRSLRGSPQYAATARSLLEERRSHLGADHPQTAVAELHYAMSRIDSVQPQELLQILARIRTGYGREHPVYAIALANAARFTTKDHAQKVRILREALASLERVQAPAEMQLATRSNLASALIDIGEIAPDVREGVTLLQVNIAEESRLGLPTHNSRFRLCLSLTIYGGNSLLPLSRVEIDEALRSAGDFYQRGDARWNELRLFSAMVRYRQNQRARADREFADLLADLATLPPGSGAAHQRNENTRMVSLVFRSLYAFQTCHDADAKEFMATAMRVKPPTDSTLGVEAAAFARALRAGRPPAYAPFMAEEIGDHWKLPAGPGDDPADPGLPRVCVAGRNAPVRSATTATGR